MATLGEIWVTLGLDTVAYDRDVEQVRGSAGGLASFLKNSFQFSVGQMMFSAITRGIKSAWDASIGFNASMEQNQIAFTTMMGDAKQAKSFLDALQTMAVKTPFQMQDLTDASKKLMAFGFQAKQIPSMLTAIGDASAGLGLSGSEGINRLVLALGQMSAKGKVSGQDMMQLTDAGIPAWDILAKAMGKSTGEVMKLSEKGLIPAKQAVDALVSGMEARFPAMMDKQSRTFSALISTIKDGLLITLGTASQTAFGHMEDGLKNVADRLQNFSQGLKQGGIKEALSTLFSDDAVAGIMNFAGWVNGTLLPLLQRISTDAQVVGGIVLQMFGGAFQALLPIVQAVLNSGLGIIANLMDWFAQHGTVVEAGLMSVVAGFVALKIIGTINELMAVFKGTSIITTGVMGALNGVMAIARGLMEAYRVQEALATAQGVITTGVMGTLDVAMGTLSVTMASLNWEVYAVIAVVAVLAGVATVVIRNWSSVAPFFKALWDYVGDVFNVAVHSFVNMFQNMWSGITDILAKIGTSVSGWVKGLAGTLSDVPVIGELFQGWSDSLGGASSAMDNYAKSVQESAKANQDYIGTSSASMSKAWDAVKSTGSSAVSAIGNDISGIVSSVKNGIGGMFKSVDDGSKVLKDSVSKDFDTTVANAKTTGDALQQAMSDAMAGNGKGKKVDIGTIIKDTYSTALAQLEGAINRLLLPTKDLNAELKNEQDALSLTDEKINLLTEEYNKMVEAKGKDSSEASGILTSLEQEKTAYQSLSDKIAETTQKIADLAEQQKKSAIDALNSLNDNIISALQKQYSAQQKMSTDNLNAQLSNIEKLRNAQLNAIDAEQQANDRKNTNYDDQTSIDVIQAQLTTETDPQKIFDLKMSLAKAEKLQKDDLNKQALEDKKATINAEFDAQKNALNQQLTNVQNFYANVLSQASLEAQAEKMLQDKNQSEIVTLLNNYGDAYKITGSSLGQKLYEGIKSWTDRIQALIAGVVASVGGGYAVANTYAQNTKQTIVGNSVDLASAQSILGGSYNYVQYQSGMAINPNSIVVGGSAVIPDSALNGATRVAGVDRQGTAVAIANQIPKMHDGGAVGDIGLKNNEALRILQDGEFVLPKNVVNMLGAMVNGASSLMGGGGSQLAGAGGSGNISIDIHDNSFKDGSDVGKKIVDALRRAGI